MQEQHRINELRKILYKEIRGELSFNEKKEFLQESINEKVILNLHEKYLKRRKFVTVAIILYSIYLAVLLLLFLVTAQNMVLTVLITIALAMIPLFLWAVFSKTVLGYEKFDIALRIINKFYVNRK